MRPYRLKNADPEEIEDLLIRVERSFNIKFHHRELAHIKSFGEFCDYIAEKIELENSEDCTGQQAFYKLRDGISYIQNINKALILTASPLHGLFPKTCRRQQVKRLESYLGLKLNLLIPPLWETATLVVLFLASLTYFFFDWKIGLTALCLSVTGFWISGKLGRGMRKTTVGELAAKMRRENYIKSRRNPETYNKREIEVILREWFSDDLDIDKEELTRDAKFI